MREQWQTARRWYQVTAPDGYLCLELASCASEAKQRASRRPGYQPFESLRARPYIPAGTSGNWDALGENVREIKEKLTC